MDIVDINKVLDDLELNEEQHSKLSKTSTAIHHDTRSNKSQTDLYAPYKYGPTSMAVVTGPSAVMTAPSLPPQSQQPSTTTTMTTSAAPVPIIPNRMIKTNFVKVSNVFNSLNEYMNAGIEAVKITEESTAQPATQINSTSSIVPNTNLTNCKNEQTGNYLYATESAISSAGFPTQIDDTGYTTVSNDVSNTNTTTTTTAAITTQLPSFIDAKSNSIEHKTTTTTVFDHAIMPVDPPSYEESQTMHASSRKMMELTESSVDEMEEPTTLSESDELESECDDEKTTDAEDVDEHDEDGDDDDEEKTGCNESMEMRTELSSVVPPTSISFDITASRETDTALHGAMNGESSEFMAKDQPDMESDAVDTAAPTSDITVPSTATIDQTNHVDVKCADEQQIVQPNNTPETISKSNERFIKPMPITFETAATMDDVSDTELASYLQELEDLEDSSIGGAGGAGSCGGGDKIKSDSVKSANGSMKSDDIEAGDGIYSIENANEMQQIVSARDDRNADSFSQASTVELGEVNASSSSEQLSNINAEHTLESAASIDSVLDADPESTIEISELQPEQNVHDKESNENRTSDLATNMSSEYATETNEHTAHRSSDREVSSDEIEPPNECSECELDQQIGGTAKRPNSLNLQNCNSTLVAAATAAAAAAEATQSDQNASGSTLNFSSDDNAGNTPPASGQFLSSSISSDDSNLIADNNQLIHQLENSQSNMDSESANESNVSENYSNQSTSAHLTNAANMSIHQIGKMAPYWVPDNMTVFCMQCNQKFSFIKRRHHCRACGLVLCSACCSLKAKLEYMGDVEARICVQCDILLRDANRNGGGDHASNEASGVEAASVINSPYGDMPSRSPNPNNPMEYCSIIPPHQQVTTSASAPISVMVPVGVLKREGVPPKSQRKEKNVMFSDGIRPGCDLTDLDNSWDARPATRNGELSSPSGPEPKPITKSKINNNLKLPALDPKTNSYIPPSTPTNSTPDTKLPPICVSTRTEFKYTEVTNNEQLIERLHTQQLKFMIQRNFYVLVKIIKLSCCINKTVINFTTQGMHLVGQDEIVILLELDESNQLPKDIFIHLNEIYRDADKGQAITELGFSMASSTPFLGSKEHGGFLFIRTTFQCMQNIIIPENPYLIGILIHRWEVPWAKIFPLRLMLRLGALHRYYPSPHLSVRGRNSVYAEIAQTIINILADFRTYSFTIPTIRGMYIHMEDRRTNVLVPRNRYDQVMKALNNSSEHIFALAGNFSEMADGHLVCVQNTESGCAETHAYSTQAINIQGKPRKVTGASFFVLNGALKSTSGLSGKCSIVEDGLMVQILPKKMAAIQQALKTMKDIDIVCGPIDGDESQTELVSIQWVENDVNFNIGVISPIDRKRMDGVPSIRVHHGLNYANSNHIIRWTEVFILKSDDESAHGKDPIDMSKLSEQIARSASMALVKFLDLLATNRMTKIAIRATLDQDQVCYEAGSNYDKLAPLYMNALDDELVPTLHRQATNLQLDQTISLELIFHIMDI